MITIINITQINKMSTFFRKILEKIFMLFIYRRNHVGSYFFNKFISIILEKEEKNMIYSKKEHKRAEVTK